MIMRPLLHTAVLLALATPAMAASLNSTATSGSRSLSNATGGNASAFSQGGGSSNVVSNTASRSGATANSGTSKSISGVALTINNGSSDPAADPSASDPAGDPSSGSYSSTIRNTPELMAPSIVGGNPCTVGATGGLSLPGFGIIGGASWEGKGCERRQLAALLYNMGKESDGPQQRLLVTGAIEILCQNDDVRDALKRVGRPCVADQPPVAAVAPAPVAVLVPAVPVKAPVWQPPDWCLTASAADRHANLIACKGVVGRTVRPGSS